MVVVKVKKIHPDAVVPRYAHDGDSGMDVYSVDNYLIKSGGRDLVRTGLQVEVPIGYEMQVRPRSGLALKKGITVLNTPGTVDSTYRGEVGVILINHSKDTFEVRKGDRVAQVVVSKVERAVIEEVNELSKSDRGEGGFGSTGLSK